MATKAGTSDVNFGHLIFAVRILVILFNITMIILNAWFLYYMDQLERDGCKCAQGWKMTFVQASLILFITIAILSFFINVNVKGRWFAVISRTTL